MGKTKLFITDHADPSVGMFVQSWEVGCPFEYSEEESEMIEFFRNAMIEAYSEFANGKITALYDIEIAKKASMDDNEVDMNRYIFLLTEDGRFVGRRKIDAPHVRNATNRIRRILGEEKLKRLKVQLVQVLDGTFTKTLWEVGDENDPE